jgi:hypothetical protein
MYLSPSTKINSKWIKDLKLLEENMGEKLDIGLGENCLDMTSVAQAMKTRQMRIISFSIHQQ